jgi:branched-chain amino acid transport system substrate-binding protein
VPPANASPPARGPGRHNSPGGGASSGGPPPRLFRTNRDAWASAALAAAVVASIVAGLLLFDPPPRRGDLPLQPEPGKARGVTATEVVVGMASPFSGANREIGRDIKAGVEAAFAAVNEAGGVHGRRLRLAVADDGYEPSRTLPAMRQLVETERVLAVVGNVGTPTAAVAIPYCAEHEVVFLGALSGSEILRADPPDRWVFNFRPSYAEETAAAVRWLVDVEHVKPGRIAVLAQEDGFGDSGWAGAVRQLQQRGAQPSRIVRVGYRRNTADVSDALAEVRRRAAGLDAVVMIATYKAAATFIRGLRDAGLPLVTTNVSPVDSNALAEELVGSGAHHATGVLVTQVVPLPTSSEPGVVRFREALARYAPGERPGFLGLEGWIVGQILAEALRRAGPEPDPDSLVAALEGIRDLDLGIGVPVSFSPADHQGSHRVWGTMLQPDGSWKAVDLP